jgi:hypothetical protein
MPGKAVWGILLALLMGCEERERLIFDTDPDDTNGPTSQIRNPSTDTTLTADDALSTFTIEARAVDPSGVDTVFIEVIGASLVYPPIDAGGADTVTFGFTLPLGNLVGQTITVGVHGVDVLGNVGLIVVRELTIQ